MNPVIAPLGPTPWAGRTLDRPAHGHPAAARRAPPEFTP